MKRRQFIAGLGSAAAWPVVVRAQQPERVRRIGMLLPAAADDPVYQTWVGAFLQGLAVLGWTIGRNVRIDIRWSGPNIADINRHAAELVAVAPNVILAHGAGPVGATLQATRTVPIVFPVAGDPVGAGLVDNVARPGGNVTGFMMSEFSLGGALAQSGQRIKPRDTVLIEMGVNKRLWGTPGYLHDFPGLHVDAVRWLADKNILMFGVEAVSPAPEGEPNFKAHMACAARGITHIECLWNLDKLVGKGRFRFIGFPLKIRGGTASPIRAVAILGE